MIGEQLTGNGNASTQAETTPACQYCATPLVISWIDLGQQPLSNNYGATGKDALAAPYYPLHARACPSCWLVQVDRVVPAEDIFSDYAYFSSYSESWLSHCRDYAVAMIDRFALTSDDLVIEVASNDGYQLNYFAQSDIQVLGIDPAANVAQVAINAGIPTEVDFFGASLAQRLVERGVRADHLSAKNVMAHVPDIGDFAHGVAILLKPEAVFTVEFPHLLETMQRLQFDQIYHEHFTYLSLVAVKRIFADKGMRVFDVEQVETHGGSLRVFICHDGAEHVTTEAVGRILSAESASGLDRAEGYAGYNDRVARIRRDFLDLLATADAQGKTVAGYGAAAKGNTFLNYCEAGPNTLAFIADRSLAKAGRFMPGSGIPILTPDAIDERRPDYLVILPWNLSHEIAGQMAHIRDWGGQFITAIPEVRVF
jgi:hypothetical protein